MENVHSIKMDWAYRHAIIRSVQKFIFKRVTVFTRYYHITAESCGLADLWIVGSIRFSNRRLCSRPEPPDSAPTIGKASIPTLAIGLSIFQNFFSNSLGKLRSFDCNWSHRIVTIVSSLLSFNQSHSGINHTSNSLKKTIANKKLDQHLCIVI
jgi:hypothetical protein